MGLESHNENAPIDRSESLEAAELVDGARVGGGDGCAAGGVGFADCAPWTASKADDVRPLGPNVQDEAYMRLALEEAQRAYDLGEVPIGAVVVYDPIDPATRRHINDEPRIIARACNLRETTNDPAGHAEFLAMKQASDELGVWRLTGCTVYVTLEPCVMCAGLMHQARIDRCVYGAVDEKAGALGTLYKVNADERLNHTYPVEAGVMGEECADILRRFFKQRRMERKAAKGKGVTRCSDGGLRSAEPPE